MHRHRILHYELAERVGEGGMGVVYRARDERLDRTTALKFLPLNMKAGEADVERFLHEARAISRLNHPNIATIYAVEEVDGERFLALEYLPGGTLRERLRRMRESGERVSPDQMMRWAVHVGRALAHAHRHGIVHRDVKPDNVLFTEDGGAKLTDFGIAQVAERRAPSGDETAGTVAYMSPEQAQGLPVDHRADIFSFGILVYEIAAGRPPFVDPQDAVTLYDIVHTPAPSLSQFRDDVPAAGQEMMDRMIAKDPRQRYQTMDEVLDDLRRLGEAYEVPTTQTRPVASREPTVAVLPFVDMSPEHDQEYFCDGITEEIILALSQVKGLKVVSRTSSFEFKDQAYDIRKIGERLGVESILEGSVRKAGDTLRITVQLINTADDFHLWSERYDRDFSDVFAVQDEIASGVVANLKLKLVAGRCGPRTRKPTNDLNAYNLYLEGRYLLNQRTRGPLEQARDRFTEAVERDPSFALAWAGLAEAYTLLASRGAVESGPKAAFAQARAASEKALELDPCCAEAHVGRALVLYRDDWDFAGAQQEFQQALALNDGYATAHHHYAMLLAAIGRLDEARREIGRAHELDPLSLIISTAVGRILHFSRRYDEAIEQCRRTIELNPSFAGAYFDLAVACGQSGRAEEAREAIDRVVELTGDDLLEPMMAARHLALVGDRDGALVERRKVEEISRRRYVSPVLLAIIDIGLGDYEQAIDELEEAFEQRDSTLVYIQCEPSCDPLREHPRFQALIERIGFPRA